MKTNIHFVLYLAQFYLECKMFWTKVVNKLETHILYFALAQLVEALSYKPEGRWLDSRWCRWNFSLT